MGSIAEIYERYLMEGGEPDPTAFGIWLIRNTPALEGREVQQDNMVSYGQPVDVHSMVAILVGRLERFAHFVTKPLLRKMGLGNQDEFALLATLLYIGRSTKMNLLRQSLMETTTGSQMIKRLKENGYILEKANPDDGRSSFIELSAKGRRFIIDCFSEIVKLDSITAGLEDHEVRSLLLLLEKLDTIHSERTGLRTIRDMMS